jgi:hypothetical protein
MAMNNRYEDILAIFEVVGLNGPEILEGERLEQALRELVILLAIERQLAQPDRFFNAGAQVEDNEGAPPPPAPEQPAIQHLRTRRARCLLENQIPSSRPRRRGRHQRLQ